MSVPACPVHKSPLKLGRDNKTYFCPKRLDSGEWCKEKASIEPGTPPAAATVRAGAHGASPKLLLLLGCLDFAAKVFQGTGQTDDAIACANEAFRLNNMEDGL